MDIIISFIELRNLLIFAVSIATPPTPLDLRMRDDFFIILIIEITVLLFSCCCLLLLCVVVRFLLIAAAAANALTAQKPAVAFRENSTSYYLLQPKTETGAT